MLLFLGGPLKEVAIDFSFGVSDNYFFFIYATFIRYLFGEICPFQFGTIPFFVSGSLINPQYNP